MTAADPRWYAEGLRFRCTACGACCTGAPGHVWVEPAEVARMARALGTSVRRFEKRFVRKVGDRLSLRERDGGDCVMLGPDRRCTVYAAKPVNCSTFPFWPHLVETEAAWTETAGRCEGIGTGDLYPADEVDRVASGDPGPLLRRHARAPEPGGQGRAPEPGGQAPAPEPGGQAPRAGTGDPSAGRGRDDPSRAPARGDRAQVAGGAEAPPLHGAREPAPAGGADAPSMETIPEATWSAALAALEEVYADLERELPAYGFTCSASGRCCDFDAYGHRLYATTIEAEWFFRHSPSVRSNEDARHCPAWGPERLCHARAGRMLGCRTYFCGPYPNGTPEQVTERFFPRIRALHDRFGIPYLYRDIVDWARERRPARGG